MTEVAVYDTKPYGREFGYWEQWSRDSLRLTASGGRKA